MEILKYIIGALIGGVVGATLTYFFGIAKDIKSKKRELTTQYLINAYQTLVNDISHRPPTNERKKKLEDLLSDIQLFGSNEQVELAKQLAREVSSGRVFELDPLIISLRGDLRKELNLSKIKGNVEWLRFGSDHK